ncbi:MAG: HAMP domain-containing protein [Nitrospirae bacterium]|nr:MAG: HAMP domain-containing protein [Nitrospirota bacterium]
MELSRSRRGLQKKFVAALLIVGFAPGIVALFATYLYSIQTIKTSIGGSFQQIAASTARRIEVMIDDEIDSARHLAATPLTVRTSVEAANDSYRMEKPQAVQARLLQRSALWERYRTGGDRSLPSFIHRGTLVFLRDWFAIRAGEYQNVLVTDERGALVASVAPTVGYLHRDELWWREAFADGHGRLYVSDIYKQPQGEYLLDIAVPVLDRTGKRAIGVVKLELRRANLMKAIMEIKVGERGHGMLLNTEGTPLICPVLPPKAHLINDPLMHQLMQVTPGWVVAEDDAHGGHNAIVGYAPIRFTHPLSETSLGGHAWYAFVRQDPDETYAPVKTLLGRVAMIGFGMVVGLASLGFFVGRLIVKPILLLQEQADAIRQSVRDLASAGRFERMRMGTSDRRVAVRSGDELESLALAFNQMAEALDESLKTIHDQHDELVRKEKLASVGQLLAALAHDIKNPLGVIRSSAQLVLDDRQSEAAKREVAQYVIEEVDRLTNRINHFLRFAREKPPEIRPVSVKVLLETALQEWRALGSGPSIAEEVRIGSDVTDLMVDPDQLKVALVNLLINAREAMPQGGTLTIVADMEGKSEAPATVVVRIVDTGCGISPEHLKHIFDPFFTTKDYGTGLGLTNAKRLVEQNGGQLAIHSQEGKGTEVVIRLPALGR